MRKTSQVTYRGMAKIVRTTEFAKERSDSHPTKKQQFVDWFCLRPGRACATCNSWFLFYQLFLLKQDLGFCINLKSHYKNMFMPFTAPLEVTTTPLDQSTGSSQSAPAIPVPESENSARIGDQTVGDLPPPLVGDLPPPLVDEALLDQSIFGELPIIHVELPIESNHNNIS